LSVGGEDLLDSGPRTRQLNTAAENFYLKEGAALRRVSAYDFAVIGLFCCTVILSVTDLITTSIALRSGLQEGNLLLLGVASMLRMSFFETIATTKLAFISGTAVLALLGIRSHLQLTRRIVFSSLAIFVVLLLFVSVNNLVMINF
jgi:hypothetical protein